MRWFRRILVVMVILAVPLAYLLYDHLAEKRRLDDARRYGGVAARVWLGTVLHRNDKAAFLAYRDSLLAAHGLTQEDVEQYMNRYEDKPEQYVDFARIMQQQVDSLATAMIAAGADTTGVDSTGVDSTGP